MVVTRRRWPHGIGSYFSSSCSQHLSSLHGLRFSSYTWNHISSTRVPPIPDLLPDVHGAQKKNPTDFSSGAISRSKTFTYAVKCFYIYTIDWQLARWYIPDLRDLLQLVLLQWNFPTLVYDWIPAQLMALLLASAVLSFATVAVDCLNRLKCSMMWTIRFHFTYKSTTCH